MCRDLLSFNGVNLDVLTETYNMPFYQTYLARWPEYFQKVVGPEGQLMGYGEAPPASSPPPPPISPPALTMKPLRASYPACVPCSREWEV